MQTPLEIFETKAHYNKWLKELTDGEKDLVLEMLKEAQQESNLVENRVSQAVPQAKPEPKSCGKCQFGMCSLHEFVLSRRKDLDAEKFYCSIFTPES